MDQLSMRKSLRAMSVVFAACLAFAAHGSANVFDDAVFWFRGGKDCVDANGYIQQGEFFDDLQADNESHANHMMGMSSSQYYIQDKYASQRALLRENAVFQPEQVVFPALGTSVLREMQVLHISDSSVNIGSTAYYCPFSVNPHSVFASNNISDEYTIVSRIRLDDLDSAECLFRIGYNDSAKQGMTLGFAKHPSHANCKYITGSRTQNSGSDNSSYQLDMRIPTNTWVDIAVVVGNGKLRVGVATPISYSKNYPSIAFDETPMWTDNCELLGETYYSLFCVKNISSVGTSDPQHFSGSVQQLAIWGRALSDQEVMAAFGMPRPAIFRTGFDNGSSNEFGGTRSGVTQTIDGLGSWQGVWDEMQAGDTWTVNFNALRDEAGLAQIFSLHSLPSSATADIEVELNGTSLGTRRVQGEARVFLPVKANLVIEGANILTVRRTDGGAGSFLVDAMELGGALGVGTEAASTSDGRTPPDRTATGVPSAADPNLQHWPQELQPYSDVTNLRFRVWVDPDVVNVASSRFRTLTLLAAREDYALKGDEKYTLFVNGTEKGEHGKDTSAEEIVLDFAPGELIGGWNLFELKSAPCDTCHWYVGYYRFETVLRRAFSLPPPGMAIIVR